MEDQILIERPARRLPGLRVDPRLRAARQTDEGVDRDRRLFFEQLRRDHACGGVDQGVEPGRIRRHIARWCLSHRWCLSDRCPRDHQQGVRDSGPDHPSHDKRCRRTCGPESNARSLSAKRLRHNLYVQPHVYPNRHRARPKEHQVKLAQERRPKLPIEASVFDARTHGQRASLPVDHCDSNRTSAAVPRLETARAARNRRR